MSSFISLPKTFDLIIVGAGHAGCEAAMASANLGLTTLVITSNLDRVGHLSCNPAIGGLGKGHMVREIDALGGCMGKWTDAATLQVRTLNESKGPAVRATRAQVDRDVYMATVKKDIFQQKNIFLVEDMAESILVHNDQVSGIHTLHNQDFLGKNILLTVGTFLQGTIHIGTNTCPGGRLGDAPSSGLSKSLRHMGFTIKRFMTCTTPRLLNRTLDFSKMEVQEGTTPAPFFSWQKPTHRLQQFPCHLTWTNEKTHQIIEKHLQKSPMYSGAIPGPGPRYCPSIEDKIARFPEKLRHQVFIEPEGVYSTECYVNGLPTGFPLPIQKALLATIPGLENCHIMRPGYAIEYDVIDATALLPTLEAKNIENLWFAGQINGTSGYEEAAAQGLFATLNIAAKLHKKPAFLPGRDEAYIAVLIDDLITKGTDDPYRMLTSRAEHRLLLRESNADKRLTLLGKEHGLVQKEQWDHYEKKAQELEKALTVLKNTQIAPTKKIVAFFESLHEPAPANALPLGELFRRSCITIEHLQSLCPELLSFSKTILTEAETIFRYSGYVARQEEMAKRQTLHDTVFLPKNISYATIPGLNLEAQEKLALVQPTNLGQAQRIPGISPSAIVCLEIHLKKIQNQKKD